MRYLATALAALLISMPAVGAAGGPDALSIAKRALRLAKEPPQVKQIFTTVAESSDSDVRRFRVRCPRGMIAVGIAPEVPTLYESVRGRRAFAIVPRQPSTDFGPGADGVTVTCIRGRLVASPSGG